MTKRGLLFAGQKKLKAQVPTKQKGKHEPSSRKPTAKGKECYYTTIKQINLQKKKIACETYIKELKPHEIMFAQEPYAIKNKICYVPKTHKAFSPFSKERKIRTAIIMPIELAKKSYVLTPFTNRDIISVKSNTHTKKGIMWCSFYMALDNNNQEIDQEALDKFSKLVEYTNSKHIPLIMGADSNGHHTLWNSYKTTPRGRIICELINKHNLNVENKGNLPTFTNTRGFRSVIDITVTNKNANKIIKSWEVDKNTSLSDHKMITIKLDIGNHTTSYKRSTDNIKWDEYREEIKKALEKQPFRFKEGAMPQERIDKDTKFINKLLTEVFNEMCPLIKITHKSKVPWNKEVDSLKKKVLKQKSTTIDCTTEENRNNLKDKEKDYRRELQRIGRQGWKDFCSTAKSKSKIAKFPKQRNNEWERLNCLKLPNGEYTKTSEETLKYLADTHYPVSDIHRLAMKTDPKDRVEDEAITSETYNRAIKSLQPKKAPGPDKTMNEMLKACSDLLELPLFHIFKRCLKHSISPTQWKTNKGIILAKPEKEDYAQPKAFRIISLTSNIQKLLEKMILIYLEEKVGIDKKLTKNQFGFRKRKCTQTALHRLTNRIEEAIANGQYALGIFLDVEGAFDAIKFNSIREAMEKIKIPDKIVNWIYAMLTDREIELELHGFSIKRRVYRGCPQGGILSPLLWNLTLNTLLSKEELDENFIQAFADDIAILIQGIDLSTIRNIAKIYLKTIDKWCIKNGVKISALKTKTVLFTNPRKKNYYIPIELNNTKMTLSDEVRYLGVILDKHLRWAPHINKKCQIATKLLMTCKKYVGKKWGLTPDKIKWIYNQVILPTLSYACFLWIHKINKSKFLLRMLEKVQKMASLQITGGFITTPTITLDCMAGIMPIEIRLENTALKTVLRLKTNTNWEHILPNPNRQFITHSHHLTKKLEKLVKTSEMKLSDKTISTTQKIKYNTFMDNEQSTDNIHTINVYTDGSVIKINQQNRAGCGFAIYKNETIIKEEAISLGTKATINQCEMLAIREGAEEVGKILNNITQINFHTDSITTIHKLKATNTSSKLTRETNLNLNKLTENDITVSIYKVKAHIGIEGNEVADKLAKRGAMAIKYGPEPFTYLPEIHIINKIMDNTKNTTLNKIKTSKIKAENKEIIRKYFEKQGLHIPTKNRDKTRYLTQIISGQNKLAANLHKLDKTVVPFCRHCPTELETTEHYMARCPAYSEVRQQTFQITHTSLKNIIEIAKASEIINYISKTGRMEDEYVRYYIED